MISQQRMRKEYPVEDIRGASDITQNGAWLFVLPYTLSTWVTQLDLGLFQRSFRAYPCASQAGFI